MNPTFKQLTGFTGDTFAATFILKDNEDAPIDIENVYESVHLYIYKIGNLDSPLYDYSIGDGLSLSDTNKLTFEFTPEQIAEIAKGVYYWRFQVTYSSKKESFLTDRFVVNSERTGTGANDGTYNVTVNPETTEITFSVASASVSAALALQAKAETETLKSETETLKGETETIATQAETDIGAAKDSAITDIGNAESSALTDISTEKTNAITAINDASDTAISAIGSEQTDAITAIENARDAGVSAVESAQSDGVDAVNSAKTTALTAIQTEVTKAETAATTATNKASEASDSADSASSSATTATTQAGIATTKAGEASTSASNAATSETNAETAYQDTVDALDAKRIEDEAFFVNENYKVREMSLASIPTPKQLIANKADLKNPNLTVVRDSTGTVFNSLGVLASKAINALRYDFRDATFRGVLSEEQRTNNIAHSLDFSQWSTVAGVTVEDGISSPGGAAGQKLIPSTSDSAKLLIYPGIAVSGEQVSFSFFVKDGGYDSGVIFIHDSSNLNSRTALTFDIGTGTYTIIDFGTFTGSYVAEQYEDGWVKLTVIANIDVSSVHVRLYVNQFNSFSGDGSSGLIVYNGQLEEGGFSTSPIITEGSIQTRDADLLTFSNVSELVKDTQNSFKFTFTTAGEGTQTLFDLYSDVNNRIYLQRNTSNEIHFKIVTSGTGQCDLNLGTVADYTEATICVGFEADNVKGCLEGGTVQSDSSVTLPSFDTLHIGRDYNDSNFWNGWIRNAQSYLKMLSETEIQTLSGIK